MNSHRQQLLAAALVLAVIGLGACDRARESTSVSAPPVASASVAVTDTDVTANVKTALLQSDSLKGTDITVVTTKGDVRLTGMLDSQAQIDDALRIARATQGSQTVQDGLTLKK